MVAIHSRTEHHCRSYDAFRWGGSLGSPSADSRELVHSFPYSHQYVKEQAIGTTIDRWNTIGATISVGAALLNIWLPTLELLKRFYRKEKLRPNRRDYDLSTANCFVNSFRQSFCGFSLWDSPYVLCCRQIASLSIMLSPLKHPPMFVKRPFKSILLTVNALISFGFLKGEKGNESAKTPKRLSEARLEKRKRLIPFYLLEFEQNVRGYDFSVHPGYPTRRQNEGRFFTFGLSKTLYEKIA